MQYPLQLRFKLIAFATQLYVSDASGKTVLYVKQKAFKLKEDIAVFADEAQRQQRFSLKADRIIDWSASYAITDASGRSLGAVKRQGARSFWSASYQIFDEAGRADMKLSEENPWIKVVDHFIDSIPVVGLVGSYFLNPSYIVADSHGTPLLRVSKRPSIFERRFEIEKLSEMKEADEMRGILGSLMMVLLERERG